LQDEPFTFGKSVIFKIHPKLHDELMIKKLGKRISKEKRMEILKEEPEANNFGKEKKS